MPSYSPRERTSGAIYAGVPTVDLGIECNSEDYKIRKIAHMKVTRALTNGGKKKELVTTGYIKKSH